MQSNEFVVDPIENGSRKREVEWEFQLPKAKKVDLPKVDLEPARKMAEQLLLTGIGASVLVSRAIVDAVKAANRAGAEAAERPGPVTETLLSLVRERRERAERAPRSDARTSVPVLPIANYDGLSTGEIIAALPDLTREELTALHEYEADHKGRAAVLKAIAGYLASE